MHKIEADLLQIVKTWKDSSYKCQFCTKVRAPLRLVSEVSEKYKDVSTKALKGDARTNSS